MTFDEYTLIRAVLNKERLRTNLQQAYKDDLAVAGVSLMFLWQEHNKECKCKSE